ncbi:thiolase family protein [Nakamurella flava]|uniref:Thiolase family protein n=1 Tax=Nakamurella flava TaxID=2576308 RepID=A0A4U6QB41_9ACTN|nr:thiolase family protein [Nakamurella flava]TKV57106.1 thiolase family protein [Nakamurella flava]
MNEAVLVDVVRTPSGKGKPGGGLSALHPVDLLAGAIGELVTRTGIDPGAIEDVIVGVLSQAGRQAVNVGRNAALAAGLPETVPGTTVDRQCGSALQATQFAVSGVMAGFYDIVLAGGVEMMSHNPINHAFMGQDPWGERIARRYPGGLIGQGLSAELVAARYGYAREELDSFAALSHQRATTARDTGVFDVEIVPVGTPRGELRDDETIRSGTGLADLARLPAVFRSDEAARRIPEATWVVTAGNSSPLTDGASVALIMSASRAAQLGLRPRARFVAGAVVGSDPVEMLTGVVPATQRVLDRAGLTLADVDAYEVNEAFAPVPLYWRDQLHADPERLNPYGGAIALGHALGSSGTRLLATLLNRLERTGGRYGLETLCEGQGMANAIVIERL